MDKREKTTADAVAELVVNILATILHVLCGGLWLMLAVAVARDHWLSGLPGLGYWWAVIIVTLLTGVFSRPRVSRRD